MDIQEEADGDVKTEVLVVAVGGREANRNSENYIMPMVQLAVGYPGDG